tara:strand:+ start:575 stop:787 length:213 start_codon:yes stop_codon:yes gene_type:complete
MPIDPEVISNNSSDGVEARKISNDNYIFIIILFVFFFSVFIMKLLIQASLILIGLLYIWKLATSKIKSSQ